jgi:hypothetical protein
MLIKTLKSMLIKTLNFVYMLKSSSFIVVNVKRRYSTSPKENSKALELYIPSAQKWKLATRTRVANLMVFLNVIAQFIMKFNEAEFDSVRATEDLDLGELFELFPVSTIGLVSAAFCNTVIWVFIISYFLLRLKQYFYPHLKDNRFFAFLYYIKIKWIFLDSLVSMMLIEQALQHIFFAGLIIKMPLFTRGISLFLVGRLFLDSLDYCFKLSLGEKIARFERKLNENIGIILLTAIMAYFFTPVLVKYFRLEERSAELIRMVKIKIKWD